jgi:hypothetical protein
VNPASYEPTLANQPAQRGHANQPDLTFPQSPGIILEPNNNNLSTTAAKLIVTPLL